MPKYTQEEKQMLADGYRICLHQSNGDKHVAKIFFQDEWYFSLAAWRQMKQEVDNHTSWYKYAQLTKLLTNTI